jgi:hypothetical protein
MVQEGLEHEAREAKKGLWVDPAPIPPWVYRKARRGQSLDLSDLVPLGAETERSASTRGPPFLGAIEKDSDPLPQPPPILASATVRATSTTAQTAPITARLHLILE